MKIPFSTSFQCKQMVSMLVAMGNGLWLAHQDWASFGWLTKPGKIVWSEGTKHLLAC